MSLIWFILMGKYPGFILMYVASWTNLTFKLSNERVGGSREADKISLCCCCISEILYSDFLFLFFSISLPSLSLPSPFFNIMVRNPALAMGTNSLIICYPGWVLIWLENGGSLNRDFNVVHGYIQCWNHSFTLKPWNLQVPINYLYRVVLGYGSSFSVSTGMAWKELSLPLLRSPPMSFLATHLAMPEHSRHHKISSLSIK